MLNDSELHELFEKLQLPELGRARVRFIRDNPQSRAVRSNMASAKTRYTGIKMPFVVEAEAVTTEYVAIVEWDHDDETLEYYSQPQALKISYLGPDRVRRISAQTTPDYLRIIGSRIVFVECKREEQLLRLANEQPGRYQRDADGRWRSPPAEAAASEFGCSYEIRSSSENNWALHENLELLKDFHIGAPAEVDRAIEADLRDRLSRSGWISMFELVHVEPAIPADQLYALIASRRLFFPITQLRLSDQESALVFRDEATYLARAAMLSTRTSRGNAIAALGVRIEVGVVFDWDGSAWQVLNDGTERLTIKRLKADGLDDAIAELRRDSLFDLVRAGRITVHRPDTTPLMLSDGQELLLGASTKDIKEAAWKLEVLENRADPAKNPFARRKRRARMYWQRKFRDAEARYGNGFVGLLPTRKGNRKPKAAPATIDLALEVIASDWESIRDCVRRHNRVPQILVSDQGAEFMSVYYETLLAILGITKRERRAGKPRAGSVCERIFNTSQSQFVKVLMGSTDLVERHFRSISPEVDPMRHAVWTLDRFDKGLEAYLDEVYHLNHHAGLRASTSVGMHCSYALPYTRV